MEGTEFPLRGRRQGDVQAVPRGRVQLVYSRGARVKSDAADFAFEHGTGLLKWVADGRAVMALRDVKDAEAKQLALVDVVNRWVVA
jgi:hypothetical protein